MQENNLEAEIQELSAQIEAKRRELEASKGIRPEEKEVVREVLKEHVSSEVTAPSQSDDIDSSDDDSDEKKKPVASGDTYLDNLDPESISKLNTYVERVRDKGIRTVVREVKNEDPFILDAFHDLLVDKLYEDLKEIGAVK